MKKIMLLGAAIAMFSTTTFAQINLKKTVGDVKKKATEVANGNGAAALSGDEVGNGLKEALNKGVSSGVDKLSLVDGYLKSELYKILMPEDMKNVVSRLKKVPGFQNVENEVIEKMNRGAEKAATKAKPIFVSAIKSMSFKDAMNILMGEKNAATTYLNTTTNEALYAEFKPIIQASLSEVGFTKYWGDAVTAYNKIPTVKKANPNLDDYVTKEALKGMFGMVAEKEKEIRENPALRTTDLMKKVFAKQDKK
jgi:Protein of unknown function (DUF4197)